MGFAFFIFAFGFIMATPICLGIVIYYISQWRAERRRKKAWEEYLNDLDRAVKETVSTYDSWGNRYIEWPEWYYEKYPEERNLWCNI